MQDYVEKCILLDKRIIVRPAAAYLMRAGATQFGEGIISGRGCIAKSVRLVIAGL